MWGTVTCLYICMYQGRGHQCLMAGPIMTRILIRMLFRITSEIVTCDTSSARMSLFGISKSLDHVRLRGGPISHILASLQSGMPVISEIGTNGKIEWRSNGIDTSRLCWYYSRLRLMALCAHVRPPDHSAVPSRHVRARQRSA